MVWSGMTWRPPVRRTGSAVSATVNSRNPGRRGTSWKTSHGPVMSMTFEPAETRKATPIGPSGTGSGPPRMVRCDSRRLVAQHQSGRRHTAADEDRSTIDNHSIVDCLH